MHSLCPVTSSGGRKQLSCPPTHPPTRPSTHPAARSGGGRKLFLKVHWLDLCSDLYVKRVSMHRVHWYPTERSAVALAVAAQPL